jgi:hypothetical protein
LGKSSIVQQRIIRNESLESKQEEEKDQKETVLRVGQCSIGFPGEDVKGGNRWENRGTSLDLNRIFVVGKVSPSYFR